MRIAARSVRKGLAVLPVLTVAVVLVGGCSRPKPALPDFADLVEQVSPSVVNISAVVPESALDNDVASDYDGGSGGDSGDSGDNSQDNPDNGADQPTPDWLKRFLQQHPGQTPPKSDDPREPDQADSPESLGSGFVLSSDGYILTNQHVVADAKEVIVRLADRRQLTAQIIGSDERSDLALLKIDATGLPAVKLADISKLRVGEWVLAIGSPFGFDYSVTAGIVSAKNRSLETEQYVPFLQTDAAINPGNSGGPLFNLRGEVVGVNSQIYSQTGGFMGVAFAIPIDVAAKVAAQLKAHGKVRRGYLGVVMEDVDRDESIKLGMDKPIGARIVKVVPNSPAEQSGLRVGDVLLAYDGTELPSSRELPAMVGNTDPGEPATLRVFRDHKTVLIRVQVGTLEDAPEAAGSGSGSDAVPPPPPLGLTVESLTDAQRSDNKVLSGGVLVTQVGEGAARDAGVRAGDVLLSIASHEIDSPQRLAGVVAQLTPGVPVPMLVQRNGSPQYLQLRVPPRARG